MAGLIMTGQRFATLSNLDMQQCPKMFCNFVQKVLAKNTSMIDWGRKYPHAGYGGSFRRWLKEKDPKPYGSYGNGSAMRVSA